MALPPPPPLTIGEKCSGLVAPRALFWVVAIYLPSMSMAGAGVIAYCIYSSEAVYSAVVPVILWGASMAAFFGLVMYMYLFLPRAPVAVPDAIIEAGGWVGLPLGLISGSVACLGQRWMVIAWSGFMVVVIAGVVAVWVRLARMYGYGSSRSTTGGPPPANFLEKFITYIVDSLH
ncbi:hypothetical protein QOZ80_7BG0583220 [Eleusine coracana subsp. coracana]|nr:hypothetical protein QOZ80_7BG0583220 [Eleusine coracana subsp. coracana]